MFKKFLMISLLISGYSFGSYESILQEMKALRRDIERHQANLASACNWTRIWAGLGGCSMGLGINKNMKMSAERRAAFLIMGCVFLMYGWQSLEDDSDLRRKIDRDYQEFSNLQKQLDALVPENSVIQQLSSEQVLALQKKLEDVIAELLQK